MTRLLTVKYSYSLSALCLMKGIGMILLVLFFFGCSKESLDEKDFYFVKTFEASDIRLGEARLNGAVFNQIPSLKYGFYYADSEAQLASVQRMKILLEEDITSDSNFISYPLKGIACGDYYYQTFAELEGQRALLGEVRTFSIQLSIFARKDTILNNTATIEGVLSGLTTLEGTILNHGIVIATHDAPLYGTGDKTVELGSTRNDGSYFAEFDNLQFNTKYYARPFFITNEKVEHGDTISFQIKDGWVKRNSKLSGEAFGITKAVSLSSNRGSFFGIGCNVQFICNDKTNINSFWNYEIDATNQGTPILQCDIDQAEYRENAVAFELDGNIYLGLGRTKFDNGTDTLHKDFLILRDNAECFEPFETDFPGVGRWAAVAFTLNGKAYVGTGVDKDSDELADFYEFDPINNSWDTIGSAKIISRRGNPITRGRRNAIAFSVGDRAFMGLGSRNSDLADFWELNTITKEWELVIEEFGGLPRSGAGFFVLDNKLCYFGAGFKDNAESEKDFFKDFWVFDPSNMSFDEIAELPSFSRGYGISFSLEGKGYYGGGENHEKAFNDLWEYTPEK